MTLLLFFFGHHVACGILVLQPGIEPMPPALEAWSLNHWTAREEVPRHDFKSLAMLRVGKDIQLLELSYNAGRNVN